MATSAIIYTFQPIIDISTEGRKTVSSEGKYTIEAYISYVGGGRVVVDLEIVILDPDYYGVGSGVYWLVFLVRDRGSNVAWDSVRVLVGVDGGGGLSEAVGAAGTFGGSGFFPSSLEEFVYGVPTLDGGVLRMRFSRYYGGVYVSSGGDVYVYCSRGLLWWGNASDGWFKGGFVIGFLGGVFGSLLLFSILGLLVVVLRLFLGLVGFRLSLFSFPLFIILLFLVVFLGFGRGLFGG